MNEGKMLELYKMVHEAKFNYEETKQSRIELVETLNTLDDKLSKLSEELKIAKLNYENKYINKTKDNSSLKSCIKKSTVCSLISIAIILGCNLILYHKIYLTVFQILSATFINTVANMIPYFYFKDNNLNNQNKMRSIAEIEKEYDELLEKRILEGMKYKKINKRELVTEKIYKGLKQELDHIQTNNQSQSSVASIDTKDIFYAIMLERPFTYESTDEKRNILDDLLIKYLRNKVSESYHGIVSPKELKIFTTKELAYMLFKQIPEIDHKEKIGNIIHAMLGFTSTIQEFSVVWFEEDDETFINNPGIVFDKEGRWSELKTHKNSNYEALFKIVYDTFINKVLKEEKHKTRKKIKN